MNKLATGLMVIALGVGLVSPAKALTEEEALGISIGVKVLTCIIADGCTSNRYQPIHHHNHRSNNQYNHNNHYNNQYRSNYQPNHPYYNNNYNRNNYDYRRNNGFYNNNQYNNQRVVVPHSQHFNNRHQNDNYRQREFRDMRREINQIYREVLFRDADHSGLSTYQDRFNSGWSLYDIRNDIEKSYEARQLRRY